MSKELRVFLAVVLASFLAVAGCSQESRDAGGDAAEAIADDAAEAAGEVVDEAADMADEAADDAM